VSPIWRGKNLVTRGDHTATTPRPLWLTIAQARAIAADNDNADALLLLGEREGIAYFTLDLSHIDDPDVAVAGGAFVPLREFGATMDRADGALLAYAKGLVHWHERHPYCARCGAPTESQSAGHVRVCLNRQCGASHFPRTDPAVIMLVHLGDRCVLAHNRRNAQPMYSTLAGFVEPGESLEEAVAREVMEEVGIRVGEVCYHSSQPWPFPGNVMLGFHAEAITTDITVEEAELVEARWFTRAEILNAPQNGILLSRAESISRRLVDDWVRGLDTVP